jgi:hypothetical protein
MKIYYLILRIWRNANMKKLPCNRPFFAATLISVLILVFFPITTINAEAPSWTDSSSGLPTEGAYFGVTFGDIDNDGNLDIVAASDGNGISVFLGDGTGVWTAVASHPVTSGGYGDVAVGDYDSDGNLDIFASSPANRESTPTGLHVFKGDGLGGFSELDSALTTLPTNGKWRGVAVGDVNNNGILDIAATAGYTTADGIHVYLGDGTGRFSDNSSGLPQDEDRGSKVVLSDFNNDGILDVAAGGNPGVSVFLGSIGFNGDMVWTESSTGLPSERFTGLNAGDFDDDGMTDLFMASYDAGSGDGLRAYRNVNNAASWTDSSTDLPDSGDYLEICTGDFDLDGNLDLVSGGVYGTRGIKLFLGDGDGAWTDASAAFPPTGERVGCEVQDVDGDLMPDILFGRYDEKGIEVWKNIPGDSAPPFIVSTNPSNSGQNVPLSTDITIHFSRSMDTVETEAAISSSSAISWSTSWTQAGSVLTLSPTENLNEDTSYAFTISTDARSANDMNIESQYQFSFKTGTTIDPGTSDEDQGSGASTILLIVIVIAVVAFVILILLLKGKKKTA